MKKLIRLFLASARWLPLPFITFGDWSRLNAISHMPYLKPETLPCEIQDLTDIDILKWKRETFLFEHAFESRIRSRALLTWTVGCAAYWRHITEWLLHIGTLTQPILRCSIELRFCRCSMFDVRCANRLNSRITFNDWIVDHQALLAWCDD